MRNIIDRVTEILTSSLMIIMVIAACWQVFTRFVLNSPSTVSEEFLRYSLIWLTMVGAANAYGKKKHLAVIFIARKFPDKIQMLINLLVEVIVLLFSIILILGGTKAFQNAVGQVSSALGMPMEYLYLSLPVGGVLFLFYSLINIAEHFKRNKLVAQERK
jgi:TRAP-type C4-dicarboxylate transport system permease small subunit